MGHTSLNLEKKGGKSLLRSAEVGNGKGKGGGERTRRGVAREAFARRGERNMNTTAINARQKLPEKRKAKGNKVKFKGVIN